jgi:hypothetical protein
MVFDIKSTQSNVSIMNADPFTLYPRHNGSSTLCPISYNGPKNVVYDQKLDCVIVLPTSANTVNNLVVVPNFDSCQTLLPSNITQKYWKAEKCENKHSITVEDIVQIKQVGENNYLYCDSFKINVYNRTIDCPSFVFGLPVTTPFTIGSLRYEAKETEIDSEISFTASVSQRITFHLMPNLHDFDFESIAERVMHEVNSMNISFRRFSHPTDSTHRAIDYILFTLIGIGVICGVVYFYRKRKLTILKPNPDGEIEEFPLETQGGSDIQKVDKRRDRGYKKSRFYKPKPTLLITALMMFLTAHTEAKTQGDIVIINFRYESPCAYLTKRNFTLFEISWCNQKFNETFIEPIERFCVTSSKVVNINRLLFHNKTKRDLHFSSLDPTKVSFPVPTIEQEWKKLDMASMAASFMMIKSTLTNMGTKWQKGEIDEQFNTSP